ncbi:hypothetical protein F442_19232 [Phytophthora nicotianae P10297]|uniref:START domain-containing protein n=1 Tax=Phytophthora nicotianae P10297 TaxID=1317064 RepID=W2YA76_PHYNI|nr:hypothetical protein F442_19232 [Phytophthora nicotianae P10297]
MENAGIINLAEVALEALKREQLRQKLHRRRMERWRNLRKEELATIRDERKRLEKKLEQLLKSAQATFFQLSPESMAAALHRVTIERTVLHQDNLRLKEAIMHQLDIESKLKRETDKFFSELQESSELSTTARRLAQDGKGWWVHFPNGEPSFFFTPLSQGAFADKLKQQEVEFAKRQLCAVTIGDAFGWKVDYVPPFRQESGTLMAHARFSRRLRCSFDHAYNTLLRLDTDDWPMVISPRSFGREQRGDFYCQPLQRFGKDDLVLVCNIPGDVHIRYIAVAQNALSVFPDGRRIVRHCAMLVDSAENARCREAEGPQEDVLWVFDGGEVCTIKEADDNSIDVVYDHWSECLSEENGRELYVDWIRYAVRLEEYVAPVRMLHG